MDKAYPKAEVWLAPRIADRAQSQKITLSAGQELTNRASVAWSANLEQHLFKGNRYMQEAVFFIRQAKRSS
ncbi:hypothetical protein ACFSN5_07740 [Streptococcus tangpeifui]|uniref:hypothetical protein n=1 Tax=Streptococcus tangpeifui TaxID=2709400 RepID=UPI0032EB053A